MEANFGYKKINIKEKEKKVQKIFSDVSHKYDIMNDFMSFGLHRVWKKKLISLMRISNKDVLLDLAGGTGDISLEYIKSGGGKAIICDLNEKMMEIGKEKLINGMYQHKEKIEFIKGSAEKVPFGTNKFNLSTISFGIRNVTYPKKVIEEAYRVLKIGGQFYCMEFFNINKPILSKLYDLYSFKMIPKIGKLIVNSEESYNYLVESIRKFNSPKEIIKMMKESGFKQIKCQDCLFGVAKIIYGYK